MSLHQETLKYGVDAASVAITAAAIAQWLPAIAALLTVIWTAIRIFETRTVQRLLGRAPLPSSGTDDDE